MKPFQIKNNCYALASTDGDSAELTLYGDIYEEQPRDWWGDPIEGQFITLEAFLKDLEQIKGCKSLAIRINSYGGDCGASLTIHNRLREMSRDGCKITCTVDGVAMSAGTHIMCACDTVRANPASLIMVHRCWAFFWGGYNANELRDAAEAMDAWDKTQVEIYKRKTGLSDTVLMHMMSDTTYMTGREAKEKGFVDEILEDAEPLALSASADGRSLFVHGRKMHLTPGMFAPENIPTAAAEPAANPTVEPGAPAPAQTYNETPAVTGEEEGGIPMTIDELRAQYPDEVGKIEANARASADHTEAVNAAVQAERTRMQEIDAVAALYPTDVVQAAKYGDHTCSAQEMTYRYAQTAAQQGNSVLQQLNDDAQAANTANVPAANSASANETKEDVVADAKAAAKAYLKDKEGK